MTGPYGVGIAAEGQWARIKSWHLIKSWTRVPGRGITLCNRTVEAIPRDTYPPGERTCETCLRIDRKRRESA